MGLTLIAFVFSLVIGISVGLVLQKGRACTNTAFRNFLLFKNNELLSFVIITVCVELIGYYILSIINIPGFKFQANPIPFSYLFIPLGGFIFGIGTVIAGGCAGGVCYRIGEGSGASALAFFGFASGIVIVAFGPLSQPINQIRDNTTLQIKGETPSLDYFLPRIVWTFFAVIILIFIIINYMRKKNSNQLKLNHLLKNWNPVIVGISLGILGTMARYSSTLSGREFGFSTTDGIAQIFESIFLFKSIGWAGIFILGLILGALLSAIEGNEFKISIPRSREVLRFYFGGILLGSGAMLGYGCNFGHIFGGLPELGISSVFSLLFMLLGNRVASYYLYIKLNQSLPNSTPYSIAIKT